MAVVTILDALINRIKKIRLNKGVAIAIYGTGRGALMIYEALCYLGYRNDVLCFIDRDEKVEDGSQLYNIPVYKLADALDNIDVVFIGALINHITVYNRVEQYLKSFTNRMICVYDVFSCESTLSDKEEYVSYIEKIARRDYKDTYVADKDKNIELTSDDPKVIAWYLPQFHRIDINDKYYGRGFTEWTNTSQTMPMFAGHYQPHIPIDVGYYDLLNVEVWRRQINLAKKYGVYGFSFYWYWFSGKRIMEKPVYDYLKDKELDFPFCITWANENWSPLWDAGKENLIFEQTLFESDVSQFVKDIIPFFEDERYIHIDGMPLLIIYRANIWSQSRTKKLVFDMKEEVKKYGIKGIYVVFTNAGKFDEDVISYNADALVEFPPHELADLAEHVVVDGYLNPDFCGNIISLEKFITEKRYIREHKSHVFFRGAMANWDNTARKAQTGATVYYGMNPQKFEAWLLDLMCEGYKRQEPGKNYIFVNAWNEWAEGSHLEPDARYGYANLIAVQNAIETFRKRCL